MRISIAILQGLALPENKPCFSVSSGTALAYALMKNNLMDQMVLIGDARRGQCWAGIFSGGKSEFKMEKDWFLVPYDKLTTAFPENVPVFTSEIQRLKNQSININKSSVYPEAAHVIERALCMLEKNIPSEPLLPLYLHPAVN